MFSKLKFKAGSFLKNEPAKSVSKKVAYQPILKKKHYIALLSTCLVFFLLFSSVSLAMGFAQGKTPDLITFPEGSISNSLFTSQNTEYKANESLTSKVEFYNVPYTLDVPQGNSARVDNGCSYAISENCIMFLTEYASSAGVSNMLIAQLGKAYMMNVDETLCVVQPYVKQSGYINGYAADYLGAVMKVTNGVDSVDVYIVGYEIKASDEYNIFIATATKVASTPVLANMKFVSDSVIQTLQFDPKLKETQDARKLTEQAVAEVKNSEATKADILNEQNIYSANSNQTTTPNSTESNNKSNEIKQNTNETTSSNEDKNSETANTSTANAVTNTTSKDPEPSTAGAEQNTTTEQSNNTSDTSATSNSNSTGERKLLIPISKDYENLTLEFCYTTTSSGLALELTDSEGKNSISPASNSNGVATFKLGALKAGEYILVIRGGDFSNCSVNLIDANTAKE